MPSPDHVDTFDKGRYGHANRNGSEEKETAGRRRGVGEYTVNNKPSADEIALVIQYVVACLKPGRADDGSDQSGSYLSPSRLLSNMGITNIRDYLPAQSQSQSQGQAGPSKAVEEGYSSWQHGDLEDGYGRR